MGQPTALFLYAFTQMWESFSYYGMRALLVLYLISQLNCPETEAYAIYAVYTCMVEFGAFLGGYCADRFTGLRSAVILGGGTICLGHLALSYADQEPLFFLGLSAIICGSMLFRSNLKALVGTLYGERDVRREAGFTLFYIGINLGGFAATLLCAYTAHVYGWHAGFGLAAIGMVLGMAFFTLLTPYVGALNEQAKTAPLSTLVLAIPLIALSCLGVATILAHHQIAQMVLLPAACLCLGLLLYKLWKDMPLRSGLTMAGLLFLLIAYFTFEELMGSLLMVFAEKQVDRQVLGWEIPSSALSATNPLVIIGCGSLHSFFLQKKRVNMALRMAVSFLCLGAAFTILYFAAATQEATALQVIISFAAIALGELFLAPTVYAYCSEASPQQHKGLMMGIVTMAFALASLLSGHLSQLASSSGTEAIPALFFGVAMTAFALALGLLGKNGFRLHPFDREA